jgi:hypothetical protein
MNFICGDKFVAMSDFVYTIPNPDDYYKHPNTFSKEAVEAFNGIPIIYTLTGNAKSLFAELAKVNKKVVIITHSADVPADKSLYDLLPPNVVKWFSQNANYSEGNRLHGIPIGIENAQRKEFHHQDKERKLLIKTEEPRIAKNYVYLNCSIWTNKEERQPLYQHLENQLWVTTVRNPNIFDFEGYIDNLHSHMFVACPSGNGIDTHRTWESLYVGTFPIEKRNSSNAFWRDLPIWFVNDWKEITKESAKKIFDVMCDKEWNLEKLEFPYWQNLIKSATI